MNDASIDLFVVSLFYPSTSYQVLIPHLVFLDDFKQVKSISTLLGKDWKKLLANCFPKIMVNILPYFAMSGQDAQVARQREKAHRVYDLLKDSNCLGKPVRKRRLESLCLQLNVLKTLYVIMYNPGLGSIPFHFIP